MQPLENRVERTPWGFKVEVPPVVGAHPSRMVAFRRNTDLPGLMHVVEYNPNSERAYTATQAVERLMTGDTPVYVERQYVRRPHWWENISNGICLSGYGTGPTHDALDALLKVSQGSAGHEPEIGTPNGRE